MINKLLFIALTAVSISGKASAHTPRAAKEKNVSIPESKLNYEFVFNSLSNRVEVKENLSTTYTCNTYRETIPIEQPYNDLEVIEDVSFKIDGKTPRDIKPEFTYYKVKDIFYSDERICAFPLPLDKQGSKGVVTFKATVLDPRFFTSIFLSEPYLVENREVTIKVPRWMHVDLKDMNFAGNSIQRSVDYDEKADADIYTYSIDNLKPQEHEKNAPGPTYLFPHILVLAKSAEVKGNIFTYFNTLQDQYNWCHKLVSSVVNNEDILKAKALEITKGNTNDIDKIKSIFYWVQNNIHYIAFEDGIAGFKPEKADEVLRKNYGDCKGMAHLTKALLKSLGYDARLCWIGTDHIAYDYTTPSLAVDNHMICAVLYQGKTYFLDATESYLGFNEYAERIEGRQVLVENGDQYLLTHIPATVATQNLDYEKRVLAITGTNLQGHVEHLWKGEDKESILSSLNDGKKDESADAFNKYLNNSNTDYAISNLTTSNLTDYDHDLTAKYDLNYKNGVSKFGKDYYVDIDFRKELNDYTMNAAERQYDYWFYYKYNVVCETQLAIPAGYQVNTLPPDFSIKSNNYEFNIQYTKTADNVTYKKTLTLKNSRLSKAQFAQWNADIAKLNAAYNQQLVLTAK